MSIFIIPVKKLNTVRKINWGPRDSRHAIEAEPATGPLGDGQLDQVVIAPHKATADVT
jgi:hypothetical protein